MVQVGPCRASHFAGILELQRLVHRSAVDAETAAREGFVTWRHDRRALRVFNAPVPHTVATDAGGRVVAYALSMDPIHRHVMPEAQAFVDGIDALAWRAGRPFGKTDYVCVGQVAVHPEHRGTGLFRRLYEGWFAAQAARYELGVTEIALDNARSRAAHAALGWREHAILDHGPQPWVVVVRELTT